MKHCLVFFTVFSRNQYGYLSDLPLHEYVQTCDAFVFVERQPSLNYPENTRTLQGVIHEILNQIPAFVEGVSKWRAQWTQRVQKRKEKLPKVS